MANEHPETVKAIRATAMTMMREAGLTDQQLAHEWNTNAFLRSAQGQALLPTPRGGEWRKGRYQARAEGVAPVQRPGSSLRSPCRSRPECICNWKIDIAAHSRAKQAAELVIGRRARSR